MKSFFDQKWRCFYMALAVLLAAGCASLSVPEQDSEEVTPTVVEAPTSEVAPVNGSAHETAVTPEGALLQKQLEDRARFQKLLEDLARYSNFNAEEAQRAQTELNHRIAVAHGGDNMNRVRLAYLLSLHPSGLGDQRAISMLDTVTKNEKVATPLRNLAIIMRAQIHEKQRALQKLEALRDVDRRLLEERMSNGRTPSPKVPTKRP
jgi:hypothetical protein